MPVDLVKLSSPWGLSESPEKVITAPFELRWLSLCKVYLFSDKRYARQPYETRELAASESVTLVLGDRECFSGKAYISLIYSTRGKEYVLGEYSGKLSDYAEFI